MFDATKNATYCAIRDEKREIRGALNSKALRDPTFPCHGRKRS